MQFKDIYAGRLVLASGKADIAKEVEAVMEEMNPAIAEKREQERRIEGIESEVKSLGRIVKEFIEEFRK